MKLVKAHVTHFRSVDDSGPFKIGQRTCLVGKNEAGKTAVLQAIHGLKPIPPFEYDVERDYPRARLNDYADLHPHYPARVVETRWKLSPGDISRIESKLGDGVLKSDEITISRSYTDDKTRWSINLDDQMIVDSLVKSMSFDAIQGKQVGKPKNVAGLLTSLNAIESKSEKHTKLIEKIGTFRKNDPVLAAIDVLDIPHFMYFSHYDRMTGQLSIEQLAQDIANKDVGEGDGVFQDFLEYAGTDVEELKKASTFESLNSKCEAASNKITDQIFEYWSQNDSLRIEVKVGRGEPGDAAPFNSGTVVRARVYNDLHRVSVPFSERSAGFIWFFSFLVKFAQVKKKHGNVVILLDEPGLTLHGKAQADLLRYFAEQLEPQHQVIYSTHSPFMVPPDDVSCVRTVEDVVRIDKRGRKRSDGTKVSEDVLATDRDTLFPLQGALGYELTQSLFIGPNTLLVEGPSEILYIQAFSNRLRELDREPLSPRWTLSPAGGIGNMIPLVSLFAGNNLNVAVLADVAKGNKSALKRLESSGILEENRVHRITDFTGGEEGDIEDFLGADLYAALINDAFSLPAKHTIDGEKLSAVDAKTERLVRKAEDYFKLLPQEVAEFDHYQPSYVLHSDPAYLKSEDQHVQDALERFETFFITMNGLLPD